MPIFDEEEDPFGPIKEEKGPASPSPAEVNFFHNRSDVDSSWSAMHHTLGTKHDQASAGDHVHDGTSSKKVGDGLNLSIDGTVNSADSEDSIVAMLQKVIDFTDNRTV